MKKKNFKKFEIVCPFFYNTPSKPDEKEINNYSVWVPSTVTNEKIQIYINGKWFEFGKVVIFKEQKKEKNISDKEYNLLKAIKEFVTEINEDDYEDDYEED